MFDWRSIEEWKRLLRYYQAGVVNTLFGYGLYSLLVLVGLNLFIAQSISHVAGVTFNHFTYSRYAFAGQRGSTRNFVVSYLLNYCCSLACLAAVSQVTPSPYLAGLITVIIVSIGNYFVLKFFVFDRKPAR